MEVITLRIALLNKDGLAHQPAKAIIRQQSVNQSVVMVKSKEVKNVMIKISLMETVATAYAISK